MRILIAEDENILGDVLKDEFESDGFEVSIARNGKEALEIMKSKSNRPDIVLLDLMMPVLNGFKFLEEIQKDETYNLKAIPVIVSSSLGQDEDIKKVMKLGAADYFVKSQHPISELIEKVKTFLEKPKDIFVKR